MKNLLLFAIFLFTCFNAFAQTDDKPTKEDKKSPSVKIETEDDDNEGTITIRYKKNKKNKDTNKQPDATNEEEKTTISKDTTIIIDKTHSCSFNRQAKRKNFKTTWLMLDYGISTYLQNGKLQLPNDYEPLEQKYFGSHNFILHVVGQRVNIVNHKLNLTYSIAFDFNRYNFANNYSILPEKSVVTFQESTVDFKKNRLNATYLMMPFMLNFETNPDNRRKSMHLSAGFYGGLLLTGRLRQSTNEDRRITVDDDFNLNKVRYGLRGELGFGQINLYVNYGLSNLFHEDQQSIYNLKPLNFGVTLRGF